MAIRILTNLTNFSKLKFSQFTPKLHVTQMHFYPGKKRFQTLPKCTITRGINVSPLRHFLHCFLPKVARFCTGCVRQFPAVPTIFHRSQLHGAALTSSFAEEATAMQLALEWATRQPPRALTLQRQSIDTRAQRNFWQRNRRHRSQNSRCNRHQPSEAHFLYTREIPHPHDAYRSVCSMRKPPAKVRSPHSQNGTMAKDAW